MRILLLALFLFSNALMAQKTKEKEIVYTGYGKVILETGEELQGNIKHSRITQRRVSIEKTDGTSETFKISEVKNFTIDNIFFEKVESPNTVGVKDFDFAIVLSGPQSKIRVYEICWQENVSFGQDAVDGVWPTHRENYVFFPAINKLKSFSDIAFTPFKKVSKLVEDCPALVAKIEQKQKGYFLNLVATEQAKMDVFKNIANDYITCK